jgi:hypothetical protein
MLGNSWCPLRPSSLGDTNHILPYLTIKHWIKHWKFRSENYQNLGMQHDTKNIPATDRLLFLMVEAPLQLLAPRHFSCFWQEAAGKSTGASLGGVYICIFIHTYVDIYIYVCVYVCICVYIYKCIYVCTYACMHGWMYACVSVCVYVCMCVRTYACTHAWMHVRVSRCLCVFVCEEKSAKSGNKDQI